MAQQTVAVFGESTTGVASVLRNYSRLLPSPVLVVTTDELLPYEIDEDKVSVRTLDPDWTFNPTRLPELFASKYPSVIADRVAQPAVEALVTQTSGYNRLVLRTEDPLQTSIGVQRQLVDADETVVGRLSDEKAAEWIEETFGVDQRQVTGMPEDEAVVVSGELSGSMV